ncbi:MAG TPA: SbcC/MukB-like Walker B domain-containing protein [Pseudobacteroides sp.]|nr:SbcC/MukB-like Walker B domain-containing protein [Pseudobacteroides sp.]
MKKLTRLLLINWHYYSLEVIEFDDINFLTGKTGAGKTTIIDAMQLVLLGETNGQHFFNKAANDRSRRTLKGYLRGEYGDDGQAGFLSLREGPFSSYIACEFFDTEKERYFTLGVVFDCNFSVQDESTYFILKDSIPENNFIEDDTPLSIRDLKAYLRKNYDKNLFEFSESGRSYQSKIKSLFGGLRDNYFSLLKKAVSFSPIIDIEEFITNNICDAKDNVDITAMQENLRYYRKLEQEANLMKSRIADLEEIDKIYRASHDEKQKVEIYQYIIDRWEMEKISQEINKLKGSIKNTENEYMQTADIQAKLSAEIMEKSTTRDSLIEQRGKNNIYQNQQSLESEKKTIEEKIHALEGTIYELVNRFHIYALNWCSAAEDTDKLIEHVGRLSNKDLFNDELSQLHESLLSFKSGIGTLLDIRAENISSFSTDQYHKLMESGNSFKTSLSNLGHMLGKLLDSKSLSIKECEEKINALKNNIKPFDRTVQIMKEELQIRLSAKYKKDITVNVLADLLEIADKRWVNTIEGYMSRQKQYILVDPEYYPDALTLYEQIKSEKGIYDIGLIDGDKVLSSNPICSKGSLAEEVVTDNPYARAYVNFLLGRVIKCDSAADLRKYDRSVTDTGMLYQGYVACQISPALWQKPLIGKKSIQEQIARLESEKIQLEEDYKLIKSSFDLYKGIRHIDTMNQNEVQDNDRKLKESLTIPKLQAKRQELLDKLSQLDLAWVHNITNEINSLGIEIEELKSLERNCISKCGVLKERLDNLRDVQLPNEIAQYELRNKQITANYSKEWISDTGEPSFKKEFSNKKNPNTIIADHKSLMEVHRNRLEKHLELLSNLRSEYNRKYGYSYDVSAHDNQKYYKALIELREEKLPEYLEKITAAKSMAYEQFVSHFLAELKANIDDVTERIAELNNSLKKHRWGSEQFSFSVVPNPDYKKFYDMITDPMLMSGYNITSHAFIEKHGPVIDELFSKIVDYDTGMDADLRLEMEKNIKIFTDYKTYLRFDMYSCDQDNNKQRLSKTLLKKSGGETQTPFYIAMLASFAQLYHVNDRNWNCIRLIIFDEAFSKMDGERIRESILLLRSIGFQCILSAPPEKIGDIAPLVDRNIVAIKKGRHSFTRFFAGNKPAHELESAIGE